MFDKIKNWGKVLVFNLLLLLVLLAVIEFFLERTTADVKPYNTLARFIRLREAGMPNQHIAMEPPYYFPSTTDSVEFKLYEADLDSNAFIQSKTYVDSPDFRIVFLGGSTTECFFTDDSLRFPSLVGQHFQRMGKKVNTYNSGIAGNHSMHSLNILTNKIIHHGFDVAVMMHNINDLVHLSYNGNYYNERNSPSRASMAVITKPEIDDNDLGFFRKFGASMRIKKAFQVVFPVTYEKIYEVKRNMNTQPVPKEFDWITPGPVGKEQELLFERNLRTFVAICRANAIRPVLMTQFNRISEDEFYNNPKNKPYLEKISNSATTVEDFCKNYHRFNDIIREVANSENVLLIDLAKDIPSTKAYLYDYVHLHNKGSRLAADLIFKALYQDLYPSTSEAN